MKRQSFFLEQTLRSLNDPSIDSKRNGLFARIPRRVRWLILSLSFSNLGVGYLIVLVTAYLPQIGFNSGFVGLIIGIFGLVPVAAGIPLGILSDRRGRKWILILGSIGVPAGLIFFGTFAGGVSFAIPYFLIGTMILGLAEAAELTTWNAIIADQTDASNRDSAFSLSFIVSSVSIGIGSAIPLVFPTLQSFVSVDSPTIHLDFILIFFAISLVTPILVIFWLKGYSDRVSPKVKSGSQKSTETKDPGALRFLLKFSAINSLIGLGAGFVIPLIPTWLFLKFSVPDTYSGPMLAVSNITMALSALASPRLSRRYGLVNSIVMTEGFSTIFMFSLAFIPNAGAAAGIYIVRASLMNMASPLADSFLMGNLSSDRRGLASAINSIIWRLPNSASTIVGGFIMQQGNYTLPFFLATTFYVTSIILFYFNFRNFTRKSR